MKDGPGTPGIPSREQLGVPNDKPSTRDRVAGREAGARDDSLTGPARIQSVGIAPGTFRASRTVGGAESQLLPPPQAQRTDQSGMEQRREE